MERQEWLSGVITSIHDFYHGFDSLTLLGTNFLSKKSTVPTFTPINK